MASTENPQRSAAAEALEQLGRLSLREHSMKSVLQTVAELTSAVMPGNTEASVSLLRNDKPSTPVSSGRLALDLDESQYSRGHGPCLHAASTGEWVQVDDARTETRWRDYMDKAVEHGSLSSLSVPLPIAEGISGALNIYAREPHAFSAESRSVADQLTPYAAVAAGNMYAYESARSMAENLQVALESRAVIDQAKGILMERYKVTPDQAFQLLAQASMRSNTKVRTVADTLVRTGEFLLP
ncbi:GAF and ANTAR domain-containing protein [Blastococcus saxobsidens]|uniref:Response regulator with antiterminator output domain n=1 Tax=Blastococcus saxobsidens (strain DD2) TaxID=1146883 RepID=H6RLM6_BLASD|nr:GAF and ANTAR domain-containing protein [Blastococcus saxobsidens]CCG03752.1 Response regulator with antiterminator output domain [Blastococcus saxobsidens DD2]